MNPRVTDNDQGEITITFEGKELRSYSYSATTQSMAMRQAREYVEGWCDAMEHSAKNLRSLLRAV